MQSEALRWLKEREKANQMRIEKISTPEVAKGDEWGYDRDAGLCRGDGEQFSVSLFRINSGNSREVHSWTQPLVIERLDDSGVAAKVGLFIAMVNDRMKILLWAKPEPGAFSSPGHFHLNPPLSASIATINEDIVSRGSGCPCVENEKGRMSMNIGEDAGRAGGKIVETSVVIKRMTPEEINILDCNLGPDHRWFTVVEIMEAVAAGYHLSSKLMSTLGVLFLKGICE